MIDINECPFCGSTNLFPIRPRYMRCGECALIFQTPRMSDAEMADYYGSPAYREKMLKKFPQKWMDQNEEKRSLRIVDLITDGKSVLDVGCSRGYILKEMRAKGYEVLGVETNSGYVLKGIPFVSSIDDIAGRGFDNITCIHTLEHVPDFMHLAERMIELLNPGGKLIIEVPGLGTPGGPFGSEHIYYFPPETIKRIFKAVTPVERIHTPHDCYVFRKSSL